MKPRWEYSWAHEDTFVMQKEYLDIWQDIPGKFWFATKNISSHSVEDAFEFPESLIIEFPDILKLLKPFYALEQLNVRFEETP